MLEKVGRGVRVIPRAVWSFYAQDGPFLAAGIAWYSLLSVFPLVLIGIATLSHVLPSTIATERWLELLALYLPPNIVKYLDGAIGSLYQESGQAGVFGLIALLWSGRHLFRALELSVHRAWMIPVRRSFVRGNFLAMCLIILCGGVTLFAGVITAFLSSIEVVLSHVKLPVMAGFTLDQAMFWNELHFWVVTPLASFLIFFLLYTMLPTRRVAVLAAMPGAMVASILLKFSSWLYMRFLSQMVAVNPLYASIGSLAGLMVWTYVSSYVFMVGAHVVSEMEKEFYPHLHDDEPSLASNKNPRKTKPRTSS